MKIRLPARRAALVLRARPCQPNKQVAERQAQQVHKNERALVRRDARARCAGYTGRCTSAHPGTSQTCAGSVERRRSDVAAVSIAISVDERRLSIRSLAVSTIRQYSLDF